MVWNRRATKKGGKVNPPEQWVWSSELTHEPIVPKELWEGGQTQTRRGSRSSNEPNSHPRAATSYVFRSFVFCDLCGNRMIGKTKNSNSDKYYRCYPAGNHGRSAYERFPNHPKTVHVREDLLLHAVIDFFAQRVFGPDRKPLLLAHMQEADRYASTEKARRIRALERSVGSIEEKISRQVRNLERQDDEDGALFRRVQDSIRELESEKAAHARELEALVGEAENDQNPELVDALPTSTEDLHSLSEEALRKVFEVFQLSIRYNREKDQSSSPSHTRGRCIGQNPRSRSICGCPTGGSYDTRPRG
jgi:site-specific DNA recombinase